MTADPCPSTRRFARPMRSAARRPVLMPRRGAGPVSARRQACVMPAKWRERRARASSRWAASRPWVSQSWNGASSAGVAATSLAAMSS